ncbi:hypothetical protein HPP92_022612 [Vanilla planifolia]|uniref:Uncharacterized protein n=1 Tax=Vanilla planifolia TaxID=51239 RepID=A0A835PRU6_VANPL|nr:hypothetical protein HPP92_022612 [Vanilla planifolia]
MSSDRTVTDVLMGAARRCNQEEPPLLRFSVPAQALPPLPRSPKPSKPPWSPDEPKKSGSHRPLLELKKKGSDFDPRAAANWKDGEPVPFLFFARALDLIFNESGRIITDIICNVFRTVMAATPDDLLPRFICRPIG